MRFQVFAEKMSERWFQKQGRSALLRYLIAALAGVSAALLRLALIPAMGRSAPYVLLFAVIVVVAVSLGTGPGLLAAAIGIWAGELFLLEPYGIWKLTWASILRISFILVGTLYVGHVGHRLRQANQKALNDSAALRESEGRLRATFDQAAMGIVEVNEVDRFIAANNRACEILGYAREELLQMNVHDLTYPEDRSMSDEMNEALNMGRLGRIDYEKRYLRRDGTPLWAHVTVSAVRDSSGKFQRAIGTIEDISRRKDWEERVRQLNQDLRRRNDELDAERARWKGVVEGIAEEVWVSDAQGRMSLINLPDVTAMGLDAFENKTLQEIYEEVDILYPDGTQRPPEEAPLVRALRGEIVRGEEIMRHHRSGKTRYRQYSAAPVRDATGEITGSVAIVRDVTDYRQMEEAMRRNEEQLRLATTAAEIGVWSWVPGTNNVVVSANWRQLFGVKRDAEVTFETWRNALHPEDRGRTVEEIEAASREHREFNTEYRVIRPDGSTRWIIDRGKAWYDKWDNPIGMAGVNVDITERRQAETLLDETVKELRRSNYDLEQFAYVASHDLQEPLRTITGYLDLVRETSREKLDEEAVQFIEHAYGGAQRMQQLIKALLSYSRAGTKGKRPQFIDLEKLLEQVLRSQQPAIAQNSATMTHDLLPVVWADETQLSQVFANLISNALKFRKESEPPRIHISAERRGRNWLFSVKDNGIGLDMKFQERIFQVFQRLHSQGKYPGSGIGLAICKRIIERHGGKMCMESRKGEGSTFYFTIPDREDQPQ